MLRITRLVLIISMLLCVSGCKIVLFAQLNETEANRILAVLVASGIPSKKISEKEGVSVLVEKSRFGEAVNLVEYYGLPSQNITSIEEMFPADGLVASPIQEWIRYNFARSQELRISISGMRGVIRADVHIAEQPKEGPFDDTVEPKVSVVVQVRRDSVQEDFIPQVKNLVSHSIPGIAYENVSVVVSPIDILISDEQNLVSSWGLVLQKESADRLRNYLVGLASIAAFCIAGFTIFGFRKIRSSDAATHTGAK